MENKLNNREISKKTKKIVLVAIITLVVFIILISGSMAYYKRTLGGNKKYVVTASSVTLILNETSSDITINNTLPQTDEDGVTNSPSTFSLVNRGNTTYSYTIYLEDDEIEEGTTRVSDEFIKFYLTNDRLIEQQELALLSSLSTDENGRILETGIIEGHTQYNYTLRFWVDYDATINDAAGKIFSVKLNIIAKDFILYTDDSGANPPELTSGMIPVVYNEKSWTWEKADTSEAWYDYDSQMWANAVTVTENTRDKYMAAFPNTPISMRDINTMWVWIPRYEYNHNSVGPFIPSDDTAVVNPETGYVATGEGYANEIKINFISSNQTTASNSSLYKIPEGFKFGEENISGFWMGKFETSTLESCTAKDQSINTGCDLTTLTPQIKPGVTSWRGARVSTFFQASRLMQSSDDALTYNANTYGFDAAGTSSMDSHMLKNTEWGIVAYLSQSKYGKYGNPNYTGLNKEVYQNKSNTYITGRSNGTPSQGDTNTQVTYDTHDTGYGASTTGTIYGVYDMSGGSSECVMGNLNNISGSKNSTSTVNSGFCGTNGPTDGTCREWPNAKYYDLYTSDVSSEAYKFGDATYETNWWYGDYPEFVTSSGIGTWPWFERGGNYHNSHIAGVFSSDYNGGYANKDVGSRFVIKP